MGIPSIPDNFFKLLIVCGLGLLIFSYLQFEKRSDWMIVNAREIFNLSDSIDNNEKILRYEETKLQNFSKFMLEQEGIDSIFVVTTDTSEGLIIYSPSYSKINRQTLRDSTNLLLSNFKDFYFHNIQLLAGKISQRKKILSDEFEVYQEEIFLNRLYMTLSAIILVIGLFGFLKLQMINDKLHKQQFLEKKIDIYCQSCAKQFSSVRLRGLNADGHENKSFCHDCYNEGKFIDSDLTLKTVINSAIKSRSYQKSNFFKKRIIMTRIKKGDRWNKDKY